MTSSSAISYPTFKALEQSNSSFIQVLQPVRETTRNSSLNHRNAASINEKGNKTGSRQNEYSGRKEELVVNRRIRGEYLRHKDRRDERHITGGKNFDDNSNLIDWISSGKSVYPSSKERRDERRTSDDKGSGDNDTRNQWNSSRKCDHLSNNELQDERLDERSIAGDKSSVDYAAGDDQWNSPDKISKDEPKFKLKIEKSQQYDIRELGIEEVTEAAKNSAESTQLSLPEQETFHNLLNKHNQKHTIIINNTFINRPTTEQSDFMSKFSPTYYSLNPKAEPPHDILPLVTESICNGDMAENIEISEQKMPNIQPKPCPDIDDSNSLDEALNDECISLDKNIPFGSIIIAIMWIILVFFWFLMYLKVISVYNPVQKVIPKPEPTNYEVFLMIFSKFSVLFRWLWKF